MEPVKYSESSVAQEGDVDLLEVDGEMGEGYSDEDHDGDTNNQQHIDLSDDDGPKSRKLKALSSKRLEASQKAVQRTGVIYLSRVPPFMKPSAVRHLLSPYGEIGRIFLTPEDPSAHKKRVKSGGNKKKSFTDGWVEFTSKKDAKLVAETLNTQNIGGKKGGWYHDDVWNIKYLKGFKWHHLTEQIANENAERAARMRAEISQTTRENKVFLQNIEKAKIMQTRETKKRKRDNDGTLEPDEKGFKSYFRQNDVKSKTTTESIEQSEEAKRVLSRIF